MQRVSLTLLVKDMLDKKWYYAERQISSIPQTYPEQWRIIRNASLSHVGEQVRRELFQAAVKLKEWAVVQQWADHSLYDDQRGLGRCRRLSGRSGGTSSCSWLTTG